MAKKMVSLNGAAPLVVAELLKDKENQALVRKGVGKAVDTGTSILKWTWITIGVIGGVGLLVWGGGKVIDLIKEAKENVDEDQRNKEVMKAAKENRGITDELWYKNATAILKAAMSGCKKDDFNSSSVSYDCEKILAVLKELKNSADWEYLIGYFGNYNGHSLMAWLGCDGAYDRASYNEILEKLNVEEKYLVSKQGWLFGTPGTSTNLLIK